MFKSIDQNGSVEFGVVSAVSLAVLVYFDKKPTVAFAAFASIVGAAAVFQHLWSWRQGQLARNWTQMEARIESGTCTEVPGRRRLYRVQVTYSYFVEDTFYGGFFGVDFRSEQDAVNLLEELKRNRFRTRVNPAHVEQSRLI